MPSSLAAALAASKKNAEATSTTQPEDAPVKTSSLAQYQNKNITANKQTPQKAETSANRTPSKPHYPANDNGRSPCKQQIPRGNNRKGGGKSSHRHHQNDNHAAGEEIVFICDIPSDDEEEDDDQDESDLDFDNLQITDQHKTTRSCRGGGGRGRSPNQRGGRSGIGRDNNGGRVLNVNASRRMIGHALGRRLGPPPNTSRESGNSLSNNSQNSNPGAKPTPWSRKAQELRNENNIDKPLNTGSREISKQTHLTDTPTTDVSNPDAMPKLKSAAIKGRWADEESSDDE